MNHAKLDPTLAAALHARADAEEGDADEIALARSGRPPARMEVFVELDGEAYSSEFALPAGVDLHGGEGAHRSATVSLGSIEALSEVPAVRRVVASRRLRPHLDVAAARIGIPAYRRWSQAGGTGTVIGIVDTGVESDHPAFAGRIHRIWDQTLPGRGVPEGGYGRELGPDDFELSVDRDGHGTYVAGVAAGRDATYPGVAPDADLVVVKSDLVDVGVADGLRYIFRVAGELGRPAVVLLSAGGSDDPHDGSDPLSAIVDAQSGPGRIVCCSAGNDGNAGAHARVSVEAESSVRIGITLPAPEPPEPSPTCRFVGWYAGTDAISVSVVCPTGAQTPFQAVEPDAPPVRLYQVPGGDVRIVTPGPDPANGDHAFLVEVTPASPGGAPAQAGGWAIRLRADAVTDGRVDIWAADPGRAPLSGRHVTQDTLVGSPGAAQRAITVGAYTTKVSWLNLVGHGHQAGFDLETIADFSSPGPGRDGAPKPDLVAPGAMVAAALSAKSPFHVPYLVDNLNVLRAGTSGSAALVAGLVALLLEVDPSLGPEEVKDLLRDHCRAPGLEPGEFDPAWGYGLLDVTDLTLPA